MTCDSAIAELARKRRVGEMSRPKAKFLDADTRDDKELDVNRWNLQLSDNVAGGELRIGNCLRCSCLNGGDRSVGSYRDGAWHLGCRCCNDLGRGCLE